MTRNIDHLDWCLLEELQENARLSHAELGRRVGLTAPAVAERIRKMEDRDLIKGYRVELNYQKLGYPLLVFVHFKLREGRRAASINDWVGTRPEIREAHRVTGDDCFIFKVTVGSVNHLELFIDDLMEFGGGRSSIVLSSVEEIQPLCEPES